MSNRFHRKLMRGIHRRMQGISLLTVVFMVIFLSSCSLPLDEFLGESGEQVGTSVARTVAARSKGEEPDSDSQAPADTETPSPALSATATPGPTDTATQPPTATLTSTPEIVRVGVSGDTFCRTGPGNMYDQESILNTDQTAEIVAKDPTGSFWYISNPDGDGECWIWGNYATPEGSTDQLPVYTPPPTPTPSLNFSADYHSRDGVAGGVYLWFVIKNTGGVPLESVTTTVKSKWTTGGGIVKKQSVTSTYNKFADKSLPIPPNLNNAAPGDTVYTSSDRNATITSSKIQVTMTICSQDNLNGECLTRNFIVNYP